MSREPTGTYFDWLPVDLIQYLSEFVTAGIPAPEYTCYLYHDRFRKTDGYRLATSDGRWICPWCDARAFDTHFGVCAVCYDEHHDKVHEYAPIRLKINMSREPTGTYFDWLPVDLLQYLSEFVTAGIPPAEYICQPYHDDFAWYDGYRLATSCGRVWICPWCDAHVAITNMGVCGACHYKYRDKVREFAPIVKL